MLGSDGGNLAQTVEKCLADEDSQQLVKEIAKGDHGLGLAAREDFARNADRHRGSARGFPNGIGEGFGGCSFFKSGNGVFGHQTSAASVALEVKFFVGLRVFHL